MTDRIFSSEVIKHSINPAGIELITLRLRYPRFIHSEFLTHRMFSRNSSSSRAVPVHRVIDMVEFNSVYPVEWGKNCRGMQSRETIDPELIERAEEIWSRAKRNAIRSARELAHLGVHKQIVNRLLEPFSIIETLVTATDWDNFFELRLHKDAQPEIQRLAQVMRQSIDSSSPTPLKEGEWHLPFIEEGEFEDLKTAKSCSVARCARVSYFLRDGKKPSVEDDLRLFDRLITERPMHASPSEHQAMSLNSEEYIANFRGWKQYRKELEGHE